MTRRRVLVVDDEPHIVELLSMNLRMNGYEPLSAGDGSSALSLARAERPDLVILDLMLPGISGLETCRLLRQDPSTAAIPVIMLSAKSEESDKVIGLGIGADDYVTKPFGLRELLARIEVALRHAEARSGGSAGAVPEGDAGAAARDRRGPEVDSMARTASLDGARLDLSPTEYVLLSLLSLSTGKALSRAEIIAELDPDGGSPKGRALDVHVRNLRRKMGPRPDGGEWVETVRGYGYRLNAAP